VHALRKYLADHAEPEIALARAVTGTYERTLVVPACREDPDFVRGYVTAAETSRGRTLCVVVVNGSDEAGPGVHAENRALLEGLRDALHDVRALPCGPPTWLGALVPDKLDVLVVDRASPGFLVPRKEGVGLARKIGTDVALALYDAGRVRSRFSFSTDADATLPPTHFELPPDVEERLDVAAVVFPFWHDAAPDASVTCATALYELSLRYYVLGLGAARSPYAFHTLGSATAVSAEAYAAVRGYPKREAAEDFYLLNKIAKVGAVFTSSATPVRLRSRVSDRTPFGTGRRVADALEAGEPSFYAPAIFDVVGRWLALLRRFSRHGDVTRLFADLDGFPDDERTVLLALLRELDARPAFEAASREAKMPAARFRRVASWFDAFRTLKLVHALRDGGRPNVPWRRALAESPFVPLVAKPPEAPNGVLVATRYAFASAERELPLFRGAAVAGE
jgi:hypothetical protein